jgi:hypothetical protein
MTPDNGGVAAATQQPTKYNENPTSELLSGTLSMILPGWCKHLKLDEVIVGAMVGNVCWMYDQDAAIEDKCCTLLVIKLNSHLIYAKKIE